MKLLQKIVFIALTAAFFAVPWMCKATRDYAPGIAVLAGIIFAVGWGTRFKSIRVKSLRSFWVQLLSAWVAV